MKGFLFVTDLHVISLTSSISLVFEQRQPPHCDSGHCPNAGRASGVWWLNPWKVSYSRHSFPVSHHGFAAQLIGLTLSYNTELSDSFLCDAHIQHIQLCRLSCTFLKLSCAKYQIQTSFGKHQGREKRKKTNPMTATYPMTQRLLSASCIDNISTHRYIFSDHTTHTYSSHDFWHGTNNTNGWNLSVIALTECQ